MEDTKPLKYSLSIGYRNNTHYYSKTTHFYLIASQI
nr:MAG TPA: hypothetical protein [Bacteriophage sp.]DAS90456.1 MAG TPA: hypothetical protein [Herelleviridae sp.]